MPPVAPRPRPEIIGTCKSQQANSGASGSETLSPMPPVECLSTFGDSPAGHSNVDAGMEHVLGEGGGFGDRHAAQIHGHRPGRHLVVGHVART